MKIKNYSKRHCPENGSLKLSIGAKVMITDVNKLKTCGKNVKIFPLAKMIHPELIEIGEGTQIDDFTLINGGKGTQIGK